MSKAAVHVHEALDIGEHAGGHTSDHAARWIAVLIAALAAILAIAELEEKATQNLYLTHHVSLSDDWSFYQAKNARATMYSVEANVLASLPGAADPAVQARIKAAQAEEARLRSDPTSGDGMKQLTERAKLDEELRNQRLHEYHLYEIVVGTLQIAIVLASVAVLTRVHSLAVAAGVLGGGSALFGLSVALGLV
jgi:hypothetical protein